MRSERACPVCGSAEVSRHSVYNGFMLLSCRQCSLIYTDERDFPLKQYDDVYANSSVYKSMLADAYLTREGTKGSNDLWWSKKVALRWLQKKGRGLKLLDLGSGPGTFLIVAQREYGFVSMGVEPTFTAAQVAKELGVPTYCGTIEEFRATGPEKFDLVTSFEVLEHLADPLAVLRSVRSLLRDGGTIVLSVPNLSDPYCLRQQVDSAMPPVHINFFCRKSIRYLLERSGFELEKTFSLPIPTSSVRNIYGKRGLLFRLPYLTLQRVLGLADGTTLLVQARAK